MEASRKAVEAYWRTRMIDQATADDDKITPVYRLDEICDTIRSSSGDLVREMIDWTFKRLEHKSPRVKQKTLRLIKYTVVKAGPEYKRDLQRQSGAIRELFHYRGQADALRGDALNKAVREAAHGAIDAIFACDDKPTSMGGSNNRMQGFGSINFDMPEERKQSLLAGVVSFGSASIRQGMDLISAYTSSGNAGTQDHSSGGYKGPILRKSLTSGREAYDRDAGEDYGDPREPSEVVDQKAGTLMHESQNFKAELSNRRTEASDRVGASQEERLLDMVTAPGGVRLQPTRESLQAFLSKALTLDPVSFGQALDSKLHVHSWQVRLKAMCVLEAILHQKDQSFFRTVATKFEEDAGVIHGCLHSPQLSLREKAKKVIDLLGVLGKEESDEKSKGDISSPPTMEIPDLTDTRELPLLEDEDTQPNVATSTSGDSLSKILIAEPVTAMSDLLGDKLSFDSSDIVPATVINDTVAGDSFHTSQGLAIHDNADDLFLGLSLDVNSSVGNGSIKRYTSQGLATNGIADDLFLGLSLDVNSSVGNGSIEGVCNREGSIFDGLSASETKSQIASEPQSVGQSSIISASLVDLMGGLSMNSAVTQHGGNMNVSSFLKSSSLQLPKQGNSVSAPTIGNVPNSQMFLSNPSLLPMGMVPAAQSNMMLPQTFIPETIGFGSVGNVLAQHMAGIACLHRFGMGINLGNVQANLGPGRSSGVSFADSFDFSSDTTSRYMGTSESSKKEETKAFDFISEHVSSARSLKKTT